MWLIDFGMSEVDILEISEITSETRELVLCGCGVVVNDDQVEKFKKSEFFTDYESFETVEVNKIGG